jgi:hypothetical protein
MRTSFHHQPEAQHPNFQLSTSWQADYPIFRGIVLQKTAGWTAPSPPLLIRIMLFGLLGFRSVCYGPSDFRPNTT